MMVMMTMMVVVMVTVMVMEVKVGGDSDDDSDSDSDDLFFISVFESALFEKLQAGILILSDTETKGSVQSRVVPVLPSLCLFST